MAQWFSEEVPPNAKNRNPGWDEYFTSNSSKIESLVREAIQNSLDAWLDKNKADDDATRQPVEIRIYSSGEEGALSEEAFAKYREGAEAHYTAQECGINVPSGACRYIVFEDFNTTGLVGSVRDEDANPYYKFFKCENWSDKTAKDLGKWGIGKVAFPISSALRTFFAYSKRCNGSPEFADILVGQYLLRHHHVDGRKFTPDGWYGTCDTNGLWMPETDADVISAFRTDFHVERGQDGADRSGTSIVVPFVDDFNIADLKQAVLENFLHAILTGRLQVRIETGNSSQIEVFDNKHLSQIRAFLASHEATRTLIPFLDVLQSGLMKSSNERIALNPPSSGRPKWDDPMISADKIEQLRKALEAVNDDGVSETVAITVPCPILYKGQVPLQSEFSVYIRKCDENGKTRPRFYRKGLYINKVNVQSLSGYLAVVVVDGEVANMLNEAEPPSHSEWRDLTGRFGQLMKYPDEHISFVTGSARQIIRILEAANNELDMTAMKRFFYVPKNRQTNNAKRRRQPGEQEIKGKQEKFYRLSSLANSEEVGFSLGKGPAPFKPFELTVSCLYNTLSGKAKYDPNDFDLSDSNSIKITYGPDDLEVVKNAQSITVRVKEGQEDFWVRVTGFDRNRDLILRPKAWRMAEPGQKEALPDDDDTLSEEDQKGE